MRAADGKIIQKVSVTTKATSVPMPVRAAIGVMAYNEERNINALLDSILAQTGSERIARVVVVASGCTDRTAELVSAYCRRDPRVELVEEPDRAGKTAAVNKFLLSATEEILIISSADLIIEPHTIDSLLKPFEDPEVGMAGAHALPLDGTKSFFGFASNMMWSLHHAISLRDPKMGELIAFRNVFRRLNPGAICDELSVHQLMRSAGYKIVYVPEAIVHNKGPETLADFVSQRMHCIVGNLAVMHEHNVPVSTMRIGPVLKAALPYAARHWTRVDWIIGTAALELYCRLKARLTYRSHKTQRQLQVWDPVASTKTLRSEQTPHEVLR